MAEKIRILGDVDTTNITVKGVPVTLWRRVKAFAAAQGLSIPDCIIELLTNALDRKKAA